MSLHILENDKLKISINSLGAELTSIYHKHHRLQYMWQGGDAWAKHSPVLFPIVGQLKNNTYIYQNKEYTLPRHGFAREKEFSIHHQNKNQITFRLSHDEQTLRVYPFQFFFDLQYKLIDEKLEITYIVTNSGNEEMYFSLGAHPAFRVPLDLRDKYDDYYLEFDHPEKSGRWPLVDGLIGEPSTPFFESNKIQLSKELFSNDALVFKNMQSSSIYLRSVNHSHGIQVEIHQCPFLGLWAAKNANFLCIEPWQGIADSVNATGKLEQKEGMIRLLAKGVYEYGWGVSMF